MKTFFTAASFFISTCIFSQNITNTLGNGGVFTIKDTSSTFWTLSQSTGQVNILNTLRLENTTSSSTGIIFKGTDRFLHNYGTNNTFLGINSGNFTMTGNDNTTVGFNSLSHNTTGSENTAIGLSSLLFNSTGINNTAVGSESLLKNRDNNNTALGYRSLYNNTNGYNNTAMGYQSLFGNLTGFTNTAVGNSAGSNVSTGSNLTLIGYNAEPTNSSATNQITLGDNQINSLRCNVTTITSLSDARDKKNIKDLSLGLDFLMKVKPRMFNWDKREWYENNISDGSKMKVVPTAGFIAQELDEAQTTENAEWLNLVLKDNPEKLEATYGNLLPVMVKAIQELKDENTQLKNNDKDMRERLLKLEQTQNKLLRELNKFKKRENKITEDQKGEQK